MAGRRNPRRRTGVKSRGVRRAAETGRRRRRALSRRRVKVRIRSPAHPRVSVLVRSQREEREGGSVVKRLALVAFCLAYPIGNAAAQDAATVIANAQKALGDLKSI